MAATKPKPEQLDPIERREQLWEQLEGAEERGDAANVAGHNANAALKRAHHDLAEARIAEVLGDASTDDVERLRAEVKRLGEEAEQAKTDSAIVALAIKRVKCDIERLHNRERDAFIADARRYTDEAAAAMEALREPYEAAYEAWSAAQTRYAMVVKDLDDLSPAPSWPWPSSVELFEATATERRTGQVAPRLPVPIQLADPVPSPEPSPPGTIHSWEREDGYKLTTTVDSEHDRALDADPNWRLVGVKRPAAKESTPG